MNPHILHTFIEAPLETIWRGIKDNATEYGSVVAERDMSVLVAQTDTICYVYALRHDTFMGSRVELRLGVTRDSAAALHAAETMTIFEAFDSLPDDADAEQLELARHHLADLKRQLHTPQVQEREMRKTQTQAPTDAGKPLFTFWSILFFFVLLGGIFSAALMLTANWLKLKQPRKAASTLFTIAISWALCIVLILVVASRLDPEFAYNTSALLILSVLNWLAAAIIILWQIQLQKPAYQAAVARSGKPATFSFKRAGLTILLLIMGGWLGNQWPALMNAMVSGTSSILTAFAPQQTYTNGRVTVSYPSHWQPTQAFQQVCENEAIHCLVTAGEPVGGGVMQLLESEDYFGLFMSAESIGSIVWNSARDSFEDLRETPPASYKLDGRAAVRYTFHYTLTTRSGFQTTRQAMVGNLIFIRDGNDLVEMEIYTPAAMSGTADMIINSLHFVTADL